jgi:hypothetical protein
VIFAVANGHDGCHDRHSYEEVVAADANAIDISTQLYWTDSPGDVLRLGDCERLDAWRLATLRKTACTWVNGHCYRLAVL